MDRKLCLDWIGSVWIGSKSSSEHPKVWRKKFNSIRYNTIIFIHICATSIHIYKKHDFYSIQFTYKNSFSLLVSFQVPCLKHPLTSREDDTTLEAFFIFQISVGNSMPGSAVSSIQCLDGSIIIIPASGGAISSHKFSFFSSRSRRLCANLNSPRKSFSRVQGPRVCLA